MRLNEKQMQRLVTFIFKELKEQKLVEFKKPEGEVYKRAVQIVGGDFQREQALDQEVNAMMDQLDRQNPGSFERYKMFPLLKKRLAEEKGIVL